MTAELSAVAKKVKLELEEAQVGLILQALENVSVSGTPTMVLVLRTKKEIFDTAQEQLKPTEPPTK